MRIQNKLIYRQIEKLFLIPRPVSILYSKSILACSEPERQRTYFDMRRDYLLVPDPLVAAQSGQ